jgi:carboxyl-terminal processing protease
MNKKTIALFLFLLLTIGSCSIRHPTEPTTVDFARAFREVWSAFDEHYVFFTYKGVDWQSTYEEYDLKFREVDTYDGFIDLLVEMLAPLKDMHVQLRDRNGKHTVIHRPTRQRNWRADVWQSYMENNNYQRAGAAIVWCRIRSIPYMHISSWVDGEFDISEFDSVLENFKESPVLIIDLRSNGGGNATLAGQVTGRFIEQPLLCGYVSVRNGPAHTDLTEPAPFFYHPRGSWKFTNTVLLLIGAGSGSSTEIFVSGLSQLSNCILIGDSTMGSVSNIKPFYLGDETMYTVSDQYILTHDQTVMEWNGIAPDYIVSGQSIDFTGGKDPILDYALEYANRLN